MTGRERMALVAFGVALIVAGFAAVFLTENEAATAIAILLGAVSVFIGAQGTPLSEIAMGENRVKLLQREMLAQQATEKAETSPSEARAMIEGFRLADPKVRRDPAVTEALTTIGAAEAYESQVVAVLREAAGPNAAVRYRGGVDDYAIVDQAGVIAVEAAYLPDRHIGRTEITRVLDRGRAAGANAILIIANAARITEHAKAMIASTTPPTKVMLWQPEEGAVPIVAAVDELRGRISEPFPPAQQSGG
jgi:hypothetical protein